MKQLLSTRSNLLLYIAGHSAKDGEASPMVELCFTTTEPRAQVVDNTLLTGRHVEDHRFTMDAETLRRLIKDLGKLGEDLDELHGRFVEAQAKLAL
jgi:hypothetical protein